MNNIRVKLPTNRRHDYNHTDEIIMKRGGKVNTCKSIYRIAKMKSVNRREFILYEYVRLTLVTFVSQRTNNNEQK